MLCFELHQNGRRVARAGLREGVLTTLLSWASGRAAGRVDDLPPRALVPGLACRLGGLNTARPRHEEHLEWAVIRRIRLGDEFQIRITRASRADRPVARRAGGVQEGRRKGTSVVRCSFCVKDRPARTVEGRPGGTAGAEAYICLQCTVLAAAFFENRARKVLHFARRLRHACSFCGTRRHTVAVSAGSGTICARCAKVAQEAVDLA